MVDYVEGLYEQLKADGVSPDSRGKSPEMIQKKEIARSSHQILTDCGTMRRESTRIYKKRPIP